ncbi:MAG: putative Ig domain-containing protein [Bryobacterales bacterium]|nr:putative Ig domain-containing protein [Bryobacterales bacterium]
MKNLLRSACWTLLAAMGMWAVRSHAADLLPDSLREPFRPDEHTVALYHFDEGQGAQTRDAMGDPALTLRADKDFLWGKRPGFGSTAQFEVREDDANLLIGPVNNDKLELRTCERAWTVEAWVRYRGFALTDIQLDHPATYRPRGSGTSGPFAKICGTDDEGFGLTHGVRGGWDFSLHSWLEIWPLKPGLLPASRFTGSQKRAPDSDVLVYPGRRRADYGTVMHEAAIQDEEWHHVAWQFRYEDQTHYFFLDGKLIWKGTPPRRVKNDAEQNDIPFVVGGILNSREPPYHLKTYDFEGEIDELRISSVMRYPVAQELTVVERLVPEAGLHAPYEATFSTDAAEGAVRWDLAGELPEGLRFDERQGTIEGTPTEPAQERAFTLRATDAAGHSDEHTFALTVSEGEVTTSSLPLAFRRIPYREVLQTRHMVEPVRWRTTQGTLPAGISLNRESGELSGTATTPELQNFQLEATDAAGQTASRAFRLKVVDEGLRRLGPDKHTVALWDWQGPSGRFIPDVMGDSELTLTWVNSKGDTRVETPGWGRYPHFIGGGEGGFIGPEWNDKVDLKTIEKEWTVEAWVRPGGPINKYGQEFHYGHVCGTYDNTERGVWELYLSDRGSPDGSLTPGVHFLGAEPEQALKDLHPYSRPAGIAADPEWVGIRDTAWHHVAWQYSYEEDLHQLFLDGTLIWEMKSPDGRRLVNNRRHIAQFSVGSRLAGRARYGGKFNWLGPGNFFGMIGEIRISQIRRY